MGLAVLVFPRKPPHQPLGSRPHAPSGGRHSGAGTGHVRARLPPGLWRQGRRLCGCVHGQHSVGQGLQALRRCCRGGCVGVWHRHGRCIGWCARQARREAPRGLSAKPAGHCRGTWRDPSRVHEWSQELDASKPVLLYCLRGKDIGRSTALTLRARGLDARYLVGGIEAWQAAGLPLETPGGAT